MESLTKQEILSQYEALKLSYEELMGKRESIQAFFRETEHDRIVFVGSGSSYSLAKSAANTVEQYTGRRTGAISAGDLLINANRYRHKLAGAIFVVLSRSGNTSEILLALERVRAFCPAPTVLLCENPGSDIAAVSQLTLELPWAFDNSVCQTRSVTNLYLAGAMLAAFLADSEPLLASLRAVIDRGEAFIRDTAAVLEEIAGRSWDKAVVLADGELEGIAEEGSLAFKEIAMLPSNFYHVMDVRHGPVVLIDEATLVIVALNPGETFYQGRLVEDLRGTKATVLLFADHSHGEIPCQFKVKTPAEGEFAAYGIPFIFLSQMLAYLKAERSGINPDAPGGLDACIVLQ